MHEPPVQRRCQQLRGFLGFLACQAQPFLQQNMAAAANLFNQGLAAYLRCGLRHLIRPR